MNFKIRSWNVSYYQTDQGKWINGVLTCAPLCFTFHVKQEPSARPQGTESQLNDGNDSQANSRILQTKYSDIKQVQKARSMLFYSAITVETFGGVTHWFSSLPDKYSIYNVLHHFVHHALTHDKGQDGRKAVTNPGLQTELGKKLLQSAEDSERTLAAAAGELHSQGRQLDGAAIDLQEIHEDMDVAERILSGLDSYLGQWRLPKQYQPEEVVVIGKDDITAEQDLEVLSSELSKDQWSCQQLCILRVANTSLTLLDLRQRLLHSLPWKELSRVFVVSPWEVILTKHVAGRRAVSVSVVSSALLPVLKLLQRRVPHLVDFQAIPKDVLQTDREDDDDDDDDECDAKPAAEPPQNRSTRHYTARSLQNSGLRDTSTKAEGDPINSSVQLQKGRQQQEILSETELLALQSKLGGLKMMASAVGEELVSQNKALDDMIVSVDRADSRVKEATRRATKLM